MTNRVAGGNERGAKGAARHLAVALMVVAACVQTTGPAKTSWAAADAPPRRQLISDDVCALRVVTYAEVRDQAGNGINGAELWLIDDWRAGPASQKTALRLGETASNGIVSSGLCLLEGEGFSRWTPGPKIRFTFYVLRQGYAFEPFVHEVATDEFLKDANQLGVQPGKPIDWGASKARQGSYKMKLACTLEAVPR